MVINKKLYKTSLSYLHFFFILWFRKKWSGGRSRGLKVFWGAVSGAIGIRNIYWTLINYSVWNTCGYIISALVTSYTNAQLIYIYYPDFLFFNFQLREETQQIMDNIKYFSIPENFTPGISMKLYDMPTGSILFKIQLISFYKSSFARAAGCFCKILKKEKNFVLVQLPSKIIYLFNNRISGTLGISAKSVLNKNYENRIPHNLFKMSPRLQSFRSAGWAWLLTAWTSKVRGYAMNPVDHPHGGWTTGGIHFRTPNGRLTWSVKTRPIKSWSNSKVFLLKNNSIQPIRGK